MTGEGAAKLETSVPVGEAEKARCMAVASDSSLVERQVFPASVGRRATENDGRDSEFARGDFPRETADYAKEGVLQATGKAEGDRVAEEVLMEDIEIVDVLSDATVSVFHPISPAQEEEPGSFFGQEPPVKGEPFDKNGSPQVDAMASQGGQSWQGTLAESAGQPLREPVFTAVENAARRESERPAKRNRRGASRKKRRLEKQASGSNRVPLGAPKEQKNELLVEQAFQSSHPITKGVPEERAESTSLAAGSQTRLNCAARSPKRSQAPGRRRRRRRGARSALQYAKEGSAELKDKNEGENQKNPSASLNNNAAAWRKNRNTPHDRVTALDTESILDRINQLEDETRRIKVLLGEHYGHSELRAPYTPCPENHGLVYGSALAFQVSNSSYSAGESSFPTPSV